MKRYKKYNFLEAVALMKKGKKMSMSQGLVHRTGYYITIEDLKGYKGLPVFVEHNGDGSIYNGDLKWPVDWIDGQRKWVIFNKRRMEDDS
jgi:hypothetical protein